MTNLEQIRAQKAFDQAGKAARYDDSDRKEFLSLARSLPSMFQNNGLLATWAFLLSKKDKKAHQALLNTMLKHFQAHFRSADLEFTTVESLHPEQVLINYWVRSGRELKGEQLMLLTAEAIAFSGWLKRAAEALCDKEGGQP